MAKAAGGSRVKKNRKRSSGIEGICGVGMAQWRNISGRRLSNQRKSARGENEKSGERRKTQSKAAA